MRFALGAIPGASDISTSDNSGDMGSMTDRVHGIAIAVAKVGPQNHAACEIRMRVVDTRIDDGNRIARSVVQGIGKDTIHTVNVTKLIKFEKGEIQLVFEVGNNARRRRNAHVILSTRNCGRANQTRTAGFPAQWLSGSRNLVQRQLGHETFAGRRNRDLEGPTGSALNRNQSTSAVL